MKKIDVIRSNINQHYKKQKEEADKKRARDNRRRWSQYYHSKAWQTLRNQYYVEHPICEVCERQGIVKDTEQIHHLHVYGSAATEEEKWQLLLDKRNLCACCLYHHHLFHDYMRMNNLDYCTINDIIKYDEKIANTIDGG